MYRFIKKLLYRVAQNQFLHEQAKKWGTYFGAKRFVAGTNVESATKVIKQLNEKGISGTVSYLGEYVKNKEEAIHAKKKILSMLDTIYEQDLNCHLSVKLTQLGLEISDDFCLENMEDIMKKAFQYQIFVNIDMEDYSHYDQTLNIFTALYEHYKNLGIAMQAYLYRTEIDMDKFSNVRIRLVKGAYNEREEISYPSKKDIDRQFLKLAKRRLLESPFTSIATHDHHIMNELISFIETNQIDRNRFEFQMLFGIRKQLQHDLVKKGFRVCTYIPFGEDWFGYYMRRLAERPQNIHLLFKDIF